MRISDWSSDVCSSDLFHSPDDNLFVVMKHQSQDIGHLTMAAQATQHLVLQLSKRQRQFQERRTITKGSGFAPDNGTVMPQVRHRPRRLVVARFYVPRMFAEDLDLGGNNPSLGRNWKRSDE